MHREPVTRYMLVPRTAPTHTGESTPVDGARPAVRRRYSLARLGPSPRSALGEDRHERLERAAGRDELL